jgi:hypothetical protein
MLPAFVSAQLIVDLGVLSTLEIARAAYFQFEQWLNGEVTTLSNGMSDRRKGEGDYPAEMAG